MDRRRPVFGRGHYVYRLRHAALGKLEPERPELHRKPEWRRNLRCPQGLEYGRPELDWLSYRSHQSCGPGRYQVLRVLERVQCNERVQHDHGPVVAVG